MRSDTDSLREAFLDIRDRLAPFGEEDYRQGDPALFHPVFERVNVLAGLPVSEATVAVLEDDRELGEAFASINRLRSVYGPRLEAERARRVIEADDPWAALSGFIFYPNYLELARMEAAGGGLKPGDEVVFLGSGPCPLSCITLSNGHAIICTGIERDPDVADLSRAMIERLGLADDLLVLTGDHMLLPLSKDTNLTMVASAAEPKDEVFRRLAEHLPSGSKVSYRTHEKGLRRLINLDNTRGAPDGFREINRVRPVPPVINTCVFLEKI